jgi:hypothetical protein
LISERLWTRKFNSTADIIGKSITLDDKSYRVVGVIPSSFIFLLSTDVYVALGASNLPPLQNRGAALGIHELDDSSPESHSSRRRLTSLEL